MVAAMLLSVFNISDPRNLEGMPLNPDNAEYTGGTIRYVRAQLSCPSTFTNVSF